MPKRTDIKKILIIGAGPIVIGQACEFDYSGTQACKALKEEGYTVVLLNSNPATIMTDPDFADRTYIEPVTPEVAGKDHREGAPRRAAADPRRPDRPQYGGGGGEERYPRQVRRRADRRQAPRHREWPRTAPCSRQAMARIGVAGAPLGPGPQLPGGNGDHRASRFPGDHPSLLHPRRHRRRHRLQPRGVRARWRWPASTPRRPAKS